MAYVLSSVSGNLISAASAGFAPTNSADVSAIASAYQVVSATATQLNAGTAYLTSVNETPISASRAGNAANASLANSAWYDGTGRFISSLPDEATVSSIASAYSESAASSKMDESGMSAYLPFSAISADENSAITSINGSSVGGGVSIPFTGVYWDSAESATADITADVLSVSSRAYTKYNGNVVNAYKGIIDSMGITHLGVASFIDAGAEINRDGYTLAFAPPTSMWTTADVATGIFAPLQYGTGAGMFLNNGSYKGYLKGNEWFVANTNFGYARGEVHQSRGCRVIVEHTGGSWAALSAKNADANVTLNNGKYYGTAKMAVANSQAYVQVQRGNSASKYNSAKLDTDYLKFYNGMTTGYLDPEDTASGTAYMPADTEYMYISSIPYWNAKLDASSIECDTASAITAIGGSAIAAGGVDEATVSAIASAYADPKQDASAMSGYIPTSESANYYPASNPSGFITSVDLSDYATTSYVDSSVSSKLDTTAFSDVSGNFLTAVPAEYATESYVDSAVSGKLDVTASSQFLTSLPDDLAYTSDVASAVSGKLDASASSDFYPMTGNPSGFLTAHQSLAGYATETYVDSAVSGKLDTTAYDSGSFYPTSNPSGFITGVDLSEYATTGYVDSSVSGKQDSSAMTAYVAKSAYDDLYSAFTALSDIISTYSGYFSSISAKVDNSAIGVTE